MGLEFAAIDVAHKVKLKLERDARVAAKNQAALAGQAKDVARVIVTEGGEDGNNGSDSDGEENKDDDEVEDITHQVQT